MAKDTIPKVVHYCWFGKNPKSELIEKCIVSWKILLPDYEIIEWNEDNFDVNIIKYTKQAYEKKKYAFVSDYARLWIVNTYGGIYVDTDVEVLKSLDCFLEDEAFMGFEGIHGVAPGLIFGSVKQNPVITEIMDIYHKSVFIESDNSNNITTIVKNTTDILLKYGLELDPHSKQNVKGIIIYPQEYFCPDTHARKSRMYGENTYTAHHYDASWMTDHHKKRLKNPIWRYLFRVSAMTGKLLRKIFGKDRWENIRNKYLKKLYDFMRGQ